MILEICTYDSVYIFARMLLWLFAHLCVYVYEHVPGNTTEHVSACELAEVSVYLSFCVCLCVYVSLLLSWIRKCWSSTDKPYFPFYIFNYDT